MGYRRRQELVRKHITNTLVQPHSGLSMEKLAKYYFGPDFWYILAGRLLCLSWWSLVPLGRAGQRQWPASGAGVSARFNQERANWLSSLPSLANLGPPNGGHKAAANILRPLKIYHGLCLRRERARAGKCIITDADSSTKPAAQLERSAASPPSSTRRLTPESSQASPALVGCNLLHDSSIRARSPGNDFGLSSVGRLSCVFTALSNQMTT